MTIRYRVDARYACMLLHGISAMYVFW